ncbi:MAG: SCP2 sterol-binding domain-containing protein [Dehalococcoidia bacterium]
MTPTKDQIREYYRGALERCLEAFAKLDDKEWGKKVSDEWTAKEHLAHLVATKEKESLPLIRQALAGEPPNIPGFEKRSDMLKFREDTMRGAIFMPTAELLTRLRTLNEEELGILDSLSEADLDKPARSPGWDRPGTVRDFFFASYLFLPGQYQEIRKAAKKKLPHWIETSTPDQVNYQMGRIFHYMPLIFRSDKGADVNATYQFTMEGDGGGQWTLAIAAGKADAADGEAPSHDVEIKTKPELWIDLTNGELNPALAIMTRKVKIGGNAGLAMKLSDFFSAEG